jgi:gliding motility-associated-like protein
MITVNPLPIPLFSADSVCVNTQTKFNDFSSGNIISWSWNFGDGNLSSLQNPSHTYSSSGAYNINLTVISAEGCTSSVTVSTMVYPKPSAHFSTNPTVAPMAGSPPTYGATINFTNQSSGGISYLWDFGDGGTSTNFNPQHYYSIIGNYIITLITTNQYGCTDTSHIATTSDGDIVFPNVFTPNANGSNGGTYDPWNTNNYVFFPFIAPVTEYKLQIFNRWGELIFESKDVKIGWDGYYRGQLCQQDTYVWKAYAKFLNGKTVGKAGDVTLLR